MLKLVSDDGRLETARPAPAGAVYAGKEALTQFWHDFFRASPKAQLEIEEAFGFGERCVMRWRYHEGDEAGTTGHVRGVDIFRVRDGLICEQFSYVKG